MYRLYFAFCPHSICFVNDAGIFFFGLKRGRWTLHPDDIGENTEHTRLGSVPCRTTRNEWSLWKTHGRDAFENKNPSSAAAAAKPLSGGLRKSGGGGQGKNQSITRLGTSHAGVCNGVGLYTRASTRGRESLSPAFLRAYARVRAGVNGARETDRYCAPTINNGVHRVCRHRGAPSCGQHSSGRPPPSRATPSKVYTSFLGLLQGRGSAKSSKPEFRQNFGGEKKQ